VKWYDFGTYDKWVELSKGLKEVSFRERDEIFYRYNRKIVKFTVGCSFAETVN
jgi:hypothetical protein